MPYGNILIQLGPMERILPHHVSMIYRRAP